jgi:peroxiredoxin
MALDPIGVGAAAPDFELPSSELGDNGKPGRKIRLSDYRGKIVLLAFYPLDFSPVCTGENACLQHNMSGFADSDAQVLGISVDSAWTHAAFKRELKLEYPLLADFNPKGKVARSYGLYLEESGITARASVIIGRDGVVKHVKVEQIPDPRSTQELLGVIRRVAEAG